MSLSDIIDATATAVAADANNAAAVFRVKGASAGTVATIIQARTHNWAIDEPPALGGDDVAANPVEFALAALASCQVVTYRFWASRLGIALDDITIDTEGDLDVRGFFGLDESVRPGFGAVRLNVTLSGPESAERYEELQRAVDAHCPVLDLFSNTTPVQTTVRVGVPA